MAVDSSLLPPEEPFDEPPPSRVFWGIVFVVMAALGAAAVLVLWPKGMPTHTVKFWGTLVIFPVGVPLLVVLHRYRAYEARKLDAEMRNQAARQFTERVSSAASLPLALAGAAYRYSADDHENAIQTVQQGSAMLRTQVPIALGAEPVKARWLVAPEMHAKPGTANDDFFRRRHVTAWLLDELLSEIAPQIEALPANVSLTIQLQVENGHSHEQNRLLLEERWYARLGRTLNVAPEASSPVDCVTLDTWMDAAIEGAGQHATLYVAIQLHPLLFGAPPAGTAEAGAALLLMPDAMAAQHKVARIASLHRPARAPLAQPGMALSTAMRWGSVAAERIAGAWQTGLDAAQAGVLREPAVKMGLTTRAIDIDQVIGHAGIAAPWLALACAAASLIADTAEQIVFIGQGEHLDCAVMKKIGGTAQTVHNHTTAQEIAA